MSICKRFCEIMLKKIKIIFMKYKYIFFNIIKILNIVNFWWRIINKYLRWEIGTENSRTWLSSFNINEYKIQQPYTNQFCRDQLVNIILKKEERWYLKGGQGCWNLTMVLCFLSEFAREASEDGKSSLLL